MTNTNPSGQAGGAASPVVLLERQVKHLNDLCIQQDRQRVELLQELEQMRKEHALQTEKIVAAIKAGRGTPEAPTTPQAVEVQNFNMPFLALSGFILKFWLAMIPAALLAWLLVFVLFAVLGGGAGILGTLLNMGR